MENFLLGKIQRYLRYQLVLCYNCQISKLKIRFNKIACGQGKVCCTRPADYIQCGIQNVRTEPIFDVRILSDQTAMYGEFPWMILILNKTVKRGKEVLQRFAGGSLIRANGQYCRFKITFYLTLLFQLS